MKAKCWSERDKTLIIERLRVNELGVQDKRFKFEQMYEGECLALDLADDSFQRPFCVVLDRYADFSFHHHEWIIYILQYSRQWSWIQRSSDTAAQLGAGCFVHLHLCRYVVFQIKWLTAGSAWLAHYTQETMLVLCGFMGVACAGTVVLMAVPVTSKGSAVGLLIAFCESLRSSSLTLDAAQFVIASGNLMWSLVTRNIAGQTKKVTTLTLMFVAYSVGAIIGPQVFQVSGRYHQR